MNRIFFIFILLFVSCNKTNTYTVNDKNKLNITMEFKVKDSYYSDEDIEIEVKMINNSQEDIYLENSEPYCGSLYKKLNLIDQEQFLGILSSNKKFYLVEPVYSTYYSHTSKRFKYILKSHDYEKFSCEYLHYNGYDREGNEYLLKSGLYKVYIRYSFKTNKNSKEINLGKEIFFTVKDRLNFWDIFIIIIGIIIVVGIFIGVFKYYNRKW